VQEVEVKKRVCCLMKKQKSEKKKVRVNSVGTTAGDLVFLSSQDIIADTRALFLVFNHGPF
jgi:hypothetical protein